MRIRKVKTNKQTRNRQRTHDEEAGAEEDGLHLDVQIDGEVDAEVVRIGEGLAHETGPLLRHFAHLRGAVGRVHLPPPSPPPPQKKYQKHERFHGESRWPKQKKNKKEKPAKTASSASPVERWFPTVGRDPPRGVVLGSSSLRLALALAFRKYFLRQQATFEEQHSSSSRSVLHWLVVVPCFLFFSFFQS